MVDFNEAWLNDFLKVDDLSTSFVKKPKDLDGHHVGTKSNSWAHPNPLVRRLLVELGTRLQDFTDGSGDELWVVEVISPFGGAEEMVEDLKANVFPDRAVHFVSLTEGGKQVKVL